ncbi:hypothetical protein Bra471DRAFT_01791 [Bradyrhizobium sp. WSM471]|nr:hypothetical protein Bra471DRAFT_01791 [Bradyrhizobium sp. WSM471]
MRNSSQNALHGTVKCCGVCGGRFGLIRHYSWRTALCTKKCVDRFAARREADHEWFAGRNWLNTSYRVPS